jgi:hypothetical protein
MRHCPHCHQPTIPARHAYLGQLLSKPYTCPNCHSVLVRKFGILEMTIVAPLLALSVALAHWDAEPLGFVLFVVSLASLGGLCLWLHTIRYEVKSD